NSGILRYVSIRYGGVELSPDNEINGLTLGGVGSGTELEYIEVFGNDDDGIEFFGGTVDLKYGVVAFCADDSYDSDNSWSGRGQYWFSIQSDDDTGNSNPNGGEHDGTESPNDPTGGPVQTVYNATYIGRGEDANIAGDNNGLTIKSNCAITYGNSIFTKFDDFAISFQDGSADRYIANEFDLADNIWFNFGGGTGLTDVVELEDNSVPT
ncbi:MAG: T9SS C-terminal target domain-containing protein, partial [Bacteroidota bacterium]